MQSLIGGRPHASQAFSPASGVLAFAALTLGTEARFNTTAIGTFDSAILLTIDTTSITSGASPNGLHDLKVSFLDGSVISETGFVSLKLTITSGSTTLLSENFPSFDAA